MWTRAALLLALALAALAALVAVRPAEYRVSRAITVNAPAGLVAERVADLQGWVAWWPPLRRHPSWERRFGGRPTGTGASCYWSGEGGVEAGRITLVAAGQGGVEAELEQERPGSASADLVFTFTAHGDHAVVLLEEAGALDLAGRVRALVVPPERARGPELEAALADLRLVAEEDARTGRLHVERTAWLPVPLAAVHQALSAAPRWRDVTPFDPAGAALAWTAGGTPGGRGSSAYWGGGTSGHPAARLTVLADEPDRLLVEVAIDEPAAQERDLEARLAPEGAGTRVTWVVTGDAADAAEVAREAAVLGPRLEGGLARLRQALARPAPAQNASLSQGP